MASWTDSRLQDPDYRRYILAGLTWDWLCVQLEPYLRHVIGDLHADLLKNGHTKPVCHNNASTYKQVKACPQLSCGSSVRFLDGCHITGSIRLGWKNSQLERWETQPWSLALLFMNAGQDPATNTKPIHTDISGVLNMMLCCTRFGINRTRVEDIRNHRNSLIHHSPTFKVKEDVFYDIIDGIEKLLLEPCLASHVSGNFVKHLDDVKQLRMDITFQDVTTANQQWFSTMDERQDKRLTEAVTTMSQQIDIKDERQDKRLTEAVTTMSQQIDIKDERQDKRLTEAMAQQEEDLKKTLTDIIKKQQKPHVQITTVVQSADDHDASTSLVEVVQMHTAGNGPQPVNMKRKPTTELVNPSKRMKAITQDTDTVSDGDITFATMPSGKQIILGSGGSSSVFRGRKGRMDVALKRLQMCKGLDKLVRREIDVCSRIEPLRQENIVGFYGSYEDQVNSLQYLVMELCDGTLSDFIENTTVWQGVCQQNGNLKAADIDRCDLIKQALNGLCGLHEIRITHRDMKPSNILIKVHNTTIVLKISDFGLSKEIDHDYTHSTVLSPATFGWMSPEFCKEEDRNLLDERTDVFSMGLVVYYTLKFYEPNNEAESEDELISQRRKYLYGKSPKDAQRQIKDGKTEIQQLYLQELTMTERHLVESMTKLDPAARPCVGWCMKHPLLMSATEQINMIVIFCNATEVPGANQQAIDTLNALKIPAWKWSLALGPELMNESNHRHSNQTQRLNEYVFLVRTAIDKYTHKTDIKIKTPALHQELWGPGAEFDNATFLSYFTSRFPELVTDVWDVAQLHLVTEMQDFIHHGPCEINYCPLK